MNLDMVLKNVMERHREDLAMLRDKPSNFIIHNNNITYSGAFCIGEHCFVVKYRCYFAHSYWAMTVEDCDVKDYYIAVFRSDSKDVYGALTWFAYYIENDYAKMEDTESCFTLDNDYYKRDYVCDIRKQFAMVFTDLLSTGAMIIGI